MADEVKKEEVKTEKPVRTIQELTSEHDEICKRAGALQYQIIVLQTEIQQLNLRLNQINLEAHELQKTQKVNEGNENGTIHTSQ